MVIDGKRVTTLKDILPNDKKLEVLFIAKTPAEKSVQVGHYFQGRQGQFLWNQLKEYNILKTNKKGYEDESMLDNNFGITDIAKKPRNYSNEPSNDEYINGTTRILDIINEYQPLIIIFVYKKVLDKIIQYRISEDTSYARKLEKSKYGFNKKFNNYFGCEVFVMPLPGVGSQTRNDIDTHMLELEKRLCN